MLSKERHWFLSPSAPGMRVQINVDPDTQLTPEIGQALEQLARELENPAIEMRPFDCTGVTVKSCRILVNCPAIVIHGRVHFRNRPLLEPTIALESEN